MIMDNPCIMDNRCIMDPFETNLWPLQIHFKRSMALANAFLLQFLGKATRNASKVALHHQGRKNLNSITKNLCWEHFLVHYPRCGGGAERGGRRGRAPRGRGAEGVGRKIMIMIVYHES